MRQIDQERDDSQAALARQIEALAEADPDALVTALAPMSDQAAALPDWLKGRFNARGAQERTLNAIATEDRAYAVAAWGRARLNGSAHCEVRVDDGYRNGPHTMFFFDRRETDGVMIVVVTNQQASTCDLDMSVTSDIRPRRTELTYDEAGTVLTSHPATAAMFGIAEDEMVGRSSVEWIRREDHNLAISQWLELVAQPGAKRRVRMQYRRGDDTSFWLEVTLENRLQSEGHIHGELLDVSEEMNALSALRHRENVLARLAEALPSGVAQLDDDTVSFCNERWSEIAGSTPAIADDLLVGMPSADRDAVAEALAAARSTGVDADIDVTYESEAGLRRCRLSIRSTGEVEDQEAPGDSLIVSLVDITDSWEFNNRLAEQAARDHLTGIANRMSVLATLHDALRRGRIDGSNTAVMYFDLNGFKGVNDRLGHAAGDELLIHVAGVISATLRSQDTVGRIGGDEFIVVCPDVQKVSVARQIASRIQRAVAVPIDLAGESVEVAISCGIAVTTTGTETPDELIAQADVAMYTDKASESVGPVMFEPQLLHRQDAERKRVDALREAPFDETLELHYQPILDLQTGETFAHEALLRWWSHGKLIAPMEFIPLAERQGMIGPIGQWVLDGACELGQVLGAEGKPQRIAMNVSPLQLRDPGFTQAISDALDRRGLAPSQLLVELTESVMLDGRDELAGVLGGLADLGVPIFIDDFGTGFATLDDLRVLPISGIKIDREFVADLEDPRTETIVGAIIELGRSLDLMVVAEGIETLYQATRLSELGAHFGQGFFFGRPAQFHELSESLPAFLPEGVLP